MWVDWHGGLNVCSRPFFILAILIFLHCLFLTHSVLCFFRFAYPSSPPLSQQLRQYIYRRPRVEGARPLSFPLLRQWWSKKTDNSVGELETFPLSPMILSQKNPGGYSTGTPVTRWNGMGILYTESCIHIRRNQESYNQSIRAFTADLATLLSWDRFHLNTYSNSIKRGEIRGVHESMEILNGGLTPTRRPRPSGHRIHAQSCPVGQVWILSFLATTALQGLLSVGKKKGPRHTSIHGFHFRKRSINIVQKATWIVSL